MTTVSELGQNIDHISVLLFLSPNVLLPICPYFGLWRGTCVTSSLVTTLTLLTNSKLDDSVFYLDFVKRKSIAGGAEVGFVAYKHTSKYKFEITLVTLCPRKLLHKLEQIRRLGQLYAFVFPHAIISQLFRTSS